MTQATRHTTLRLLARLMPVLVVAFGLTASEAHSADQLVHSGKEIYGLRAHGDTVGWIESRQLVLQTPQGRVTPQLPGKLTDFDLGESPSGGTRAIYKRCPSGYLRSARCKAFTYDPATSAEQPVALTTTKACRLGGIAAWRNTVAFGRLRRDGIAGKHCREGLYIKTGSGKARRVAGDEAEDVDLDGGTVVWWSQCKHWDLSDATCESIDAIRRADGKRCRVDAGSMSQGGDGGDVYSPRLYNGSIYWNDLYDGVSAIERTKPCHKRTYRASWKGTDDMGDYTPSDTGIFYLKQTYTPEARSDVFKMAGPLSYKRLPYYG